MTPREEAESLFDRWCHGDLTDVEKFISAIAGALEESEKRTAKECADIVSQYADIAEAIEVRFKLK